MDFLYFNFHRLPKELESLKDKKRINVDIEWYSTLVVLGNRIGNQLVDNFLISH